jgi:hypothetical protein
VLSGIVMGRVTPVCVSFSVASAHVFLSHGGEEILHLVSSGAPFLSCPEWKG